MKESNQRNYLRTLLPRRKTGKGHHGKVLYHGDTVNVDHSINIHL